MDKHVSDTKPKQSTRRTGSRNRGVWLWFGKKEAKSHLSQPAKSLKSIQADLPDTDPLRRARLQTQRYLEQLDKPGHEIHLNQLRAEKKQRFTENAKVALSPGRRRAEELKAEYRTMQQQRPTKSANPSTATSFSTLAPARAAAERAPLQVTTTAAARRTPAKQTVKTTPQSQSIKALILLIMLLIFALIGALISYGYNWYRRLEGSQEIGLVSETFSMETKDSPGEIVAIPTGSEALLSNSEPTSVPDDAAGTTVVESLSLEDLQVAAYEDAVLLLERELARALVLEFEFVDGIYTSETLDALTNLADDRGLGGLGWEVLSAALNPTRQELESWLRRIESNL